MDALSQLVFRIEDGPQRAAVLLALQGPGKPAGIERCIVDQDSAELTVFFDASRTSSALVRHLVAIERSGGTRTAAPAPDLDDAALARLVAGAISDPELDEHRILEHLVPELDA